MSIGMDLWARGLIFAWAICVLLKGLCMRLIHVITKNK
jgi:hypothetical protein